MVLVTTMVCGLITGFPPCSEMATGSATIMSRFPVAILVSQWFRPIGDHEWLIDSEVTMANQPDLG